MCCTLETDLVLYRPIMVFSSGIAMILYYSG